MLQPKKRALNIACAIYFTSWLIGLSIAFWWMAWETPIQTGGDNNDPSSFFIKIFSHPFLNILSNNLIYGVIIFALAALSYGAIPALSFIYNGFILGTVIKGAFLSGIPTKLIVLNLLHAPIEIIAFCMLASTGFFLIKHFKEISSEKGFPLKFFVKILILSFSCILVAATIEYASYTIHR